jgi:DNA-binding response OmpR family regulator
VLLASDNGASRPLLGAQLADHGYRIVETAATDQTLLAAHDGVEAIVIDAGPDGRRGWELLPQLRRASPEAHTPLLVLSMDTQQEIVPALRGSVEPMTPMGGIAELVRVLGGPGEMARVLIVEREKDKAQFIGETFLSDASVVKLANSQEQAMNECLIFQPHIVVLNLDQEEAEGFSLVSWMREQEMLFRTVVVAYAGRTLAAAGAVRQGMDPAELLQRAHVQPGNLELMLLTLLRGSHPLETDEALTGSSALQGF